MRNIFFFIFSVVTVAASAQPRLVTSPAKPIAGTTVDIRYNPKNTTLEGISDFVATAYLLDGGQPVAVEIPIKEEKGIYVGRFSTNANTRAFFVSFSKNSWTPDETRDNNDEKGYYFPLYDASGKVITGAWHAVGTGFEKYSRTWRMKSNTAAATDLYKKEFASADSRTRLYNEYFTFLAQSGDPANEAILKKELQNHLAKDLSEKDMMAVKMIYERALQDKAKAEAVFATVKNKFPKGAWKRDQLYEELHKAPDIEKKKIIFEQIMAGYPPVNEENRLYNYLSAGLMAQEYALAGDYDKMEHYLSLIPDKSKLPSIYFTRAAELSGRSVYEKATNAPKGIEFSEKALALLKEEMKNLSYKPGQLTKSDYLTSLNNTYHTYLNVHAILLYHNNEIEKAYDLEKQAVEVLRGMNPHMNENLTLMMEKVEGPEAAQKRIEQFISKGLATPAMKEQLKSIYLKKNSPADFAGYISSLEKKTFTQLKAGLAKKMVSTPAPRFNLKDLSGKDVSLESLKGKIVVVDFWATWCGPCKRGFPGMQKLVERYKTSPDVVFLFINTLEVGEERPGEVTSFIRDNNYNFTVLYDEPQKHNPVQFTTATDYKVSGIPAKFVIDRSGNIRFSKTGFNGSMDALIDEITAMIELADASAQDGPAVPKKAMK